MPFPDAGPLVSAAWLKSNLGTPGLRILDATFLLPGATATRAADRIIAGAIRFDVDAVKDPGSALPHMLPPAEVFRAEVEQRGIGSQDMIVCYDREGMAGAARCWWMFRAMGHDNIRVLDGGIDGWVQADGPVAATHSLYPAATFVPAFRPELVRSLDQVLANIASGQATVLDARPAGRFTAEVPEPRAGLRGGHIPGSKSLPAGSLTQREGRYMLPPETLAGLLADVGATKAPLIASCGSGMTACVIALSAAVALNRQDVAVYDGSWTEWGGRPDVPVDTGA